MDDINWGFWAATVLSAGLLGVLLESFTSLLTGFRQRHHQRELQGVEHAHLVADHQAERDHQAALQRQRLDHERELLELQRRHARLGRRDEAHHNVANGVAQQVAGCIEWFEYELGTKHGPNVDYYPELSLAPTIDSPREVAAILQGISHVHPTKEVREAASALRDELTGHYGAITYDADGNLTTMKEPSVDQLVEWHGQVRALLEMIHEPPVP